MLLVLHCTRCTRSTTSLAKTVLPHASPGNGRSLTRILDARTASLRCRSASVSRRIILTIDRSASVSQIFIIIITIIVLTIIIKQVSFGLPDKKFGPAADEETRAPRKILTITESYSLPEVEYHKNQYFTILYNILLSLPKGGVPQKSIAERFYDLEVGIKIFLSIIFSLNFLVFILRFGGEDKAFFFKFFCSHSSIWRRRTSSSSSTGRRTGSSARLRKKEKKQTNFIKIEYFETYAHSILCQTVELGRPGEGMRTVGEEDVSVYVVDPREMVFLINDIW